MKPRLIAVVSIVALAFFVFTSPLFSQDSDELNRKKKEIEELQNQLQKVQGEKQTLSSTVNYLNGKINLTEKEIQKTETELKLIKDQILDLNNKITSLDKTLHEVTGVLIHRINQTYKRSRIDPFFALLATGDLSQMLTKFKYLESAQRNDRQIMYQMEATRVDFNNQKLLKQEKQKDLDSLNKQLESQKKSLASQQVEKQKLLELTKNDERRFQTELSRKLAELEAIQSIIAGKGDETEVGDVEEGTTIAQVISGPSTCSSGAHLHLEVAQNGAHKNPADYLSSKSVTWDNAPDTAFSFNGSWGWPLNDTIRVTQGFGMTFYAATLRYYGGAPHTGIDMVNNQDYTVKAIKKGKLYRGAIGCRGGTLRYVRVAHDDGLSSYYLHVNY